MKRSALASVVAFGMAGAAFGEVCEVAGGDSVPEIEAFNQMMLNREFGDVATALETIASMKIDGALQSASQVCAEGLYRCTTIAQRRDVGGITRHLVLFRR